MQSLPALIILLLLVFAPTRAQDVDSSQLTSARDPIILAALGGGAGPTTSYSYRVRLHFPYIGIGYGYANRKVESPPSYQEETDCSLEGAGSLVSGRFELAPQYGFDVQGYLELHPRVTALISGGLVVRRLVAINPLKSGGVVGCEEEAKDQLGAGVGVEWFPTDHFGVAIEGHTHLGFVGELVFRW